MILVSIPETGWQAWVEALTESSFSGVELPVGVLQESENAAHRFSEAGLGVCGVHGLFAGAAGRFFFESDRPMRERLMGAAREVLCGLGELGASYVTLDVALERMADDPAGVAERVRFLQQLVSLGPRDLQFAIRIRCPRQFTGCRAWESAADIILEAMHPACRICVDAYPGETGGSFSPGEFIRLVYIHTAVIRFHWEPELGEDPVGLGVGEWLRILRRVGYRGHVAFTPRVTLQDPDDLTRFCERMGGQLAELVKQNGTPPPDTDA